MTGLGGGGNQNIRKEITLGRLEDSRIPPAIRLKQLKNQNYIRKQINLNNPYGRESQNTTQTNDTGYERTK